MPVPYGAVDFRGHAGEFAAYVFAARELGEIRLPFFVEGFRTDLRFGDVVDDELEIRVAVDELNRLGQVLFKNKNVVD